MSADQCLCGSEEPDFERLFLTTQESQPFPWAELFPRPLPLLMPDLAAPVHPA
jgi:hypothetical protein